MSEREVCTTCKGRGVVQTFGMTAVPTFPPRWVVCPKCRGWRWVYRVGGRDRMSEGE
jgi:DnaJ-class molecular chaperone